MSKEQITEIKNKYHSFLNQSERSTIAISQNHLNLLIQQAERVEELGNRNQQLEYASAHNGELNEYLNKRNLPAKTLGKHVVKVVMDYANQLEKEVKHHKKLLNKLQDDIW